MKTPKGRLVTTMVVFAVIGGGILVYRSFAATPVAWNNSEVVNSAGTESLIAGEVSSPRAPATPPCAVVSKQLGNALSPNPGFNLSCKSPGVTDPYGLTAAFVVPKSVAIDNSQNINMKYVICASVRGKGDVNLELKFLNYKNDNQLIAQDTFTINHPNNYRTYCSKTGFTPWTLGQLYGKVTSRTGGSSIDVSTVSYKYYYQNNVTDSWSYYVSGADSTQQGRLSPRLNGATVVASNGPSASTALRMVKGGSINATFSKSIPAGQKILVCVTAAYEGPVKAGELFSLSGSYTDQAGGGFSDFIGVRPGTESSAYQDYCTDPKMGESVFSKSNRSSNFTITSNFSAPVKVNGMYLRFVNY